MSLPAAHRRNQQAVVKMVEAKGLSLRGGRRPTWQSREGTCSSYKPPLKWCAPIASVAALVVQGRRAREKCSGAQRAPCRLAMVAAQIQRRKASRFVIARPRRGRGNLGKAVTISPIVFLGSGSVLRDCHVASLLAMTRQGSAVVHQRSPAVELLPTGRSLSAATVKFGSDRVRRHSVYIGSAFPRLPRARSALAMTNLRTLHR